MRPACDCGSQVRHLHFGGSRGGIGAVDAGTFGVPLNAYIDRPTVQFMNIDESRDASMGLIAEPPAAAAPEVDTFSNVRFISSSADDDLVIFLPLQEYITLKGLLVLGSGGDEMPSMVKMYRNLSASDVQHRGFSGLAALRSDEEVTLALTDHAEPVLYGLRNVGLKWTQISSVLLWFQASRGGEKSTLGRVILYGDGTGKTTNPKLASNVAYELRPNPADYVGIKKPYEIDASAQLGK